MTSLRNDKFKIKLPMPDGSLGEAFYIWKQINKAALRDKDSIEDIEGKMFEKIVTQKALSTIISDVEDTQQRAIQACEIAHRI